MREWQTDIEQQSPGPERARGERRRLDRAYVGWLVTVSARAAMLTCAALLLAASWPGGPSLLLRFCWPLLLIAAPFFGIGWLVAAVCARSGGAFPAPVRRRLLLAALAVAVSVALITTGVPCSLAFGCVRGEFEQMVESIASGEAEREAERQRTASAVERAAAEAPAPTRPSRLMDARIGLFPVIGWERDRRGGVVFTVFRNSLLLFDNTVRGFAWTPDGQPPAIAERRDHWARPLPGHPGWYQVGGTEHW